MPKAPKQVFGKLEPTQRKLLAELIQLSASVAAVAAGALWIDEQESPTHPISVDNVRSELGLELGKLNSSISHVMSVNIADSDFALEGMRREQEKFRAFMGGSQ